MQKFVLTFIGVIFLFSGAVAQEEVGIDTKYDPHALFSPLFYPVGGTISRAATGEPNVGYWQNKADYQINASLNDVTHEISGNVIITAAKEPPIVMQIDDMSKNIISPCPPIIIP